MSYPCPCPTSLFKPVTHVIFDLDGVILDSETLYKEAYKKTIQDYGHEFEEEFYRQVVGLTSLESARITREKYGLNAQPHEIVDKYRSYSMGALPHLKLIPGVEKVIRHLHQHGIPIAIATSSASHSFQVKTDRHKKIFELFCHVVCGDDPEVRKSKPYPDEYLVCASRFPEKPPPGECLVFEDSVNGMRAALAAQMQVVLIPNKTVPSEITKEATLKIDRFEDLKLELFGLPSINTV